MNAGDCLHLCAGFLCTEGKHQNYPCPYRNNIGACSAAIPVTKEMEESWKNDGRVFLNLSK